MSGGQAPRHALVTGGSRGIGAAIVRRLAAEGHHVTVLGRGLQAAQALAAQDPGHLHAVAADVADAAQMTAALADARARFGPITVLVNNAGQAESAPFLKMDIDLWQRMLHVNLTGTMVCTQAVLPDMLAAGWGRIVNVASTAGRKGYAYVSAYCAAKHGVIGLTRSLALELAAKGVTVNAVCPGYTDTDIVRTSVERVAAKTGRSAQSARNEFTKVNPQGRLVDPDEVADAVVWLCGTRAAAVTGQAVSVSGGEVM
ncbi:SDR family NAD(P)-dependent oxidoreductase [Castellaniella hirudinis]|uniref:SDR family NAD(P)-dependent oxidoreductase n=1 Tax=Castellaniella hirudinis TaxID=1144617 RepID=A0ABV8RW75_9BURK